MPWKASGSYEECLEALHCTAERIGRAEHIAIAGAGATGVELAAEIRFEFKDKTVVLLCADKELVGGDSTAGPIERELDRLGVDIKKGARSESVEELEDGKTQVTLSNGETLVTGLYLPTMGLVPNTEFLPAECLTERKYADVDEQFRVKAVENAWALGDVVSKPRASLPETEAQVSYIHTLGSQQTLTDTSSQATSVAKNIELTLKGQGQLPVKGFPIDVFLCSMGHSRGVGRLGWVKVPSICIWAVKGRTLGRERTAKYANGTAW